MNSVVQSPIPALNFHVWQPCNMACSYCFAEFSEAVPALQKNKPYLRDRALTVVESAARAGIQKLTLVGGEPTLCPWLLDLLKRAKSLGMVTMVVSNGSRMDALWVKQHVPWLDWCALSVDSLNPRTNRAIGRSVGARFLPDEEFYVRLFESLRNAGVRLKLNTVVSSLNWQEDFSSFLQSVQPERWKVLQALHIRGENDKAFPAMSTTPLQFQAFLDRHGHLRERLMLAAEDNESMKGSYLMVDPLGRFFSNAGGMHRYSQPIWDVGWEPALAEVEVSRKKFLARGGMYSW